MTVMEAAPELRADTVHSVRDEHGNRWPVIDGIPFLRAGRTELAQQALEQLDRGSRMEALVLLLADQDDWWTGPTAAPADLRRLVQDHDRLTLRDAMVLLAWGPVADYFAHRWSDPTFVAGLSLTETHWNAPQTAFELACGIGHHLRELSNRGVACTGADVVFAKLWLCRHYVAPHARLLCLDAGFRWPLTGRFDLVTCHDAFYFLAPKTEILARLRALCGGVLLLSHVHNRDFGNLSAGAAMTAAELASLVPDGVLYDDDALTQAAAHGTVPRSATLSELAKVEAFGAATGPGLASAQSRPGLLSLPPTGTFLRRNPLYDERCRVAWPSGRYALEYGPRATYPAETTAPATAFMGEAAQEWARRREMLGLPERW